MVVTKSPLTDDLSSVSLLSLALEAKLSQVCIRLAVAIRDVRALYGQAKLVYKTVELAPKNPNTISWPTADAGSGFVVDNDGRRVCSSAVFRHSRVVAEHGLCEGRHYRRCSHERNV